MRTFCKLARPFLLLAMLLPASFALAQQDFSAVKIEAQPVRGEL